MTFDERIKALNDIDQEFDNDVIRGFGEALNIIDELREEIKNLLCLNAEQARRANALRDSMEDKIKELESRQPKWISVEDRYPTDYNAYLVIRKDCDGEDKIDVDCYCFDKKEGYACFVDDFEEDTSVTHWMPLPEPPTTEKEN